MSAIYNPIILNTKNAFNLGGMSGPVVKSTLTPFQGACIWGCLFVLSATLHSAESAITKISPWKVRLMLNASSYYNHAIYCNQMVFPSFSTYHFDYINPNNDQLIIKFFCLYLNTSAHFIRSICPLILYVLICSQILAPVYWELLVQFRFRFRSLLLIFLRNLNIFLIRYHLYSPLPHMSVLFISYFYSIF